MVDLGKVMFCCKVYQCLLYLSVLCASFYRKGVSVNIWTVEVSGNDDLLVLGGFCELVHRLI